MKGYTIYQIDETLFNAKSTRKKAHAPKGKRLVLLKQPYHNHTPVSVMGAINSVNGQTFHLVKYRYFKSDHTIMLVKRVIDWHKENGGKPAFFMDNCSCHVSKKCMNWYAENGVEIIKNVPYCP